MCFGLAVVEFWAICQVWFLRVGAQDGRPGLVGVWALLCGLVWSYVAVRFQVAQMHVDHAYALQEASGTPCPSSARRSSTTRRGRCRGCGRSRTRGDSTSLSHANRPVSATATARLRKRGRLECLCRTAAACAQRLPRRQFLCTSQHDPPRPTGAWPQRQPTLTHSLHTHSLHTLSG